ncbi:MULTISPECIES: ABC transporter ATP-binding protein [Thermomonosporaceae]|uniref:ABC transporter ATP-binding protein n=1 Tax=Thermomonosporaceae TaxID=2012 RepID=UPI00255AF2A9|nr:MULTISPECIES: ABC transporter ATP-binding protein [Thermomonosporaceae]MDL4775352.1 ABC transporter ATP-binding protein [Actinomadura xylanilytica]
MTGDGAVLALSGVSKTFRQGRRTLAQRVRRAPDDRREVCAVDGVDLRVGAGEILGLVGPNGAGKSTTVRMMATLLEPTRGTVEVCGVDAVAEPGRARRHLGVVIGGERSVYWKLTGRENLEYFAALYHLPPRVIGARIDQVLRDTDLLDRAGDYAERYSTGMRQRLSLARALLQEPAVLLLDEPTSGLDPRSAAQLRERIARLREDGRSVLITTHNMEEADRLCDRIAVIDRGRVVRLGAPAELKRLVEADQVARVRLRVGRSTADGELVSAVGAFATVADKRADGADVDLVLHLPPGTDLLPRLVEVAQRHDAVVHKVDIEPVTLQDVFLSVTGPGAERAG